MKSVRQPCFGDHDVYGGLNVDSESVDEQGWNSDSRVFGQVISWLKPKRIIEVGSWKGRSAIRMGLICRSLNLDTEIICIDTWLGSPEHWLETEWRDSLRLVNGRPHLYSTFLNNVVARGLEALVTPLNMTSSCAAAVLAHHEITAEVVFIDGAHDYASVANDLSLYFPLVEEGGVMIIDDYLGWESVTTAADDFAKEQGLKIIGEEGKGLLCKSSNPPIKQKLVFL